MPPETDRARANADFAIEVNFVPDTPDPARVFRTMTLLIGTFQKFDRELVQTIDVNIQPVMLLEDVETGSIRSWLKAALESTDDSALKEGNWKKLVGSYLVKAKYATINFLDNKTEIGGKADLELLQREIQAAAEETGVKRIPAYNPPSLATLAHTLSELTNSVAELSDGDSAFFQTAEGSRVEFNLTIKISPTSLEELITERSLVHNEEMILKVKKPDFLGDSRWEFVHDTIVEARILDLEWLAQFRNDEVILVPGTAIRATVRVEVGYGYEREVVSRKFEVLNVHEVIPPPTYEQRKLLQ